jgi:PAS domain S-box-containing protein
MDEAIRILIVEDLPSDAELAEREISKALRKCSYRRVETRQEYIETLETFRPDLIVSDFKLPSFDGLAALKIALERTPITPVIILTGSQNEDTAVECMKAGATDYVIKEHIKRLGPAVIASLEQKKLRMDKERAEASLRKNEERYRIITENMKDTVWIMDMDFRTTYISPSVVAARGYTLEELQEMPIEKHMTPESIKIAVDTAAKELTPERLEDPNVTISWTADYEYYRKDGSSFMSEITITLTRDADGRPEGFLGVGRDITERREAEWAVRESEQRYRELVENIADIVYIADDRGNVLFVNGAAERFFGYSREKNIGRSFVDFLVPASFETATGIFKRQLAGEEVGTFELDFYDNDGTIRTLETKEKLIWEGDRVIEVHGIGRDVTQRKRAVETIRESERHYRELVENIADIVYVTDEQGKIVFLNAAAEQFIGRPGEKILGRSFADFLTPESLKTSAEIFTRQRSGEDIGAFELDIYDSHGDVRTIETREKLVWSGDHITEFQGIGRDITERKSAQRAIGESEQRYRDLVENIDDVVYVTDDTGKIIYLNKALERVSGYTREELLQKNYMELLTPDSLKEVVELFKAQKKGRDVGLFELSIVDKDGKIKIVEAREQMVWEGKRIVQMRGLGRDITGRKHAQERIAHLNRVLESIRTIDQLIVRVQDKDALLTGACEILCEVSGYYFVWIGLVEEGHMRVVPAAHWGFEDGYLKTIAVTWDDTPGGRGPMGTAIRTKRPCVFSDLANNPDFAPWRDKAAKRGYRSLMAVPVIIGKRVYGALGVYSDRVDVFDDEEAALMVEMAEDIAFALNAIEAETERRRSEEALKESEEKFRDFFETSRDIVFITAKDGAILDVNRAFEEILGYTRQETLSKNVAFFYKDPQDRDQFRAATDTLGFIGDYEATLRRKNGSFADCLITAVARRDHDEKVIGYQGTIRDISEKKQMERQLIQAEKLSSLGGILSGVAHEMNNPLTSIIGIAQMIMRGPVPEEIREKLDVIHRESMRTAKIIQGLLTFAREHKPERKMILVNKIIEESYRLREYEFRVDGIEMKLELAKNIPLTAADPYQLQQVFINLINNSRDALADGGGSVLIIRSFRRENSIVIEFEDDGPGIPEQDMGFIFDPFFTTKDVGKGTGLGLSIVYGIINEHGGKIEVKSSSGKGAKFTIFLPVIKTIAEKTTAPKVLAEKPKGVKSVLVVEDEESLRMMIREVLEQDGYRVQQCEGGQQAIEMMKTKRFDAIITDLKMPGIGGKELYTFVQKYYPVLAPRVLFITGDVLGKDTQAFLKITGNVYLEKPFEIEVLLARLSEVLEN